MGEGMESYDVAVVGAGNAALCAALSAREAGANVIVFERAPRHARGGNSAFTAGAMRVAYRGVNDILELAPEIPSSLIEKTDFGSYDENEFFDDLARVTNYRTDPELADILVRQSFDTLRWMRSKGVQFAPIYGRQAFNVGGRFRFWGGLTLEASGGGPGLIDALCKAASSTGIPIEYDSRVTRLLMKDGEVAGVRVLHDRSTRVVRARSVILASGGFEANAEWRTRYLGPGWELAKVRGSRFNTGDGIRMALEVGAAAWGNWSGAHACAWEFNAPPFGDLRVGDGFQKHSYPFSVMVNADGQRFVDEGADFRNFTYAKYGRIILAQPGQIAWQIFDQKVTHLLRDEYRIKETTKFRANTLEDLAHQMDGINESAFLQTIKEYNKAVQSDAPFDPNVKDHRSTSGLTIEKSNWANTIDEPPYEAYAVTCGITFTFGGLHISTGAEVISEEDLPIPGLYAAGELVGGIFYFNYPGGSGLTNGSVFGRIAGANAAKHARASGS